MPKTKLSIFQVIRNNAIAITTVTILGALFSFSIAQYQKPFKQAKKANDSVVIISKSVDSLKYYQKQNRKDIDTLLLNSADVNESIDTININIAEIKGMLKILIGDKLKTPN